MFLNWSVNYAEYCCICDNTCRCVCVLIVLTDHVFWCACVRYDHVCLCTRMYTDHVRCRVRLCVYTGRCRHAALLAAERNFLVSILSSCVCLSPLYFSSHLTSLSLFSNNYGEFFLVIILIRVVCCVNAYVFYLRLIDVLII